MIVTVESLQGEPKCGLNVNMIERLSSVTPSDITNDQSCFAPITNIMENINNAEESDSVEEKSDSVEEDKGIINKHETQMMPSTRVIN